MSKTPVQLLKKKVSEDSICYKFKWSNGSISSEPMTALTAEMLLLVQEYELKNHNSTEPKVSKQQKQCVIIEEAKKQKESPSQVQQQNQQPKTNGQQQQDDGDEIIEIHQGHKPRKNKPCFIKTIKNLENNIYFEVKYDGEPEKLMLVDDLKKISPISLCDYLLAKVKMGAKKSA